MRNSYFVKKQKTVINSHLFFLFLFVVCVGSSFWLYKNKQSTGNVSVRNIERKVIYPTLYSDLHITKNAVISDPKLRNLSFFDKKKVLANSISSAGIIKATSSLVSLENGTWLWTDILKITPKYRNSIIAQAKKSGIYNIYLSLDTYLDIYAMPFGEERDKKQKEFDTVLDNFISEADKNKMTVDAEAGWRNWAEDGNTYKAFIILNYVRTFNQSHDKKFRGIQYDIEPYLLDEYSENKQKVLTNFLNLADQISSVLGSDDLQLSFVVPNFYDGVEKITPQFLYNGKNGFIFDHLLNILDTRDNSKIILMSYRNFSSGDNGSVSISRDEIYSADNHKTRVVIAQETSNVEPSYITFHNTSLKYYRQQIADIEKAFSKNKGFGGVATHYINSLVELN